MEDRYKNLIDRDMPEPGPVTLETLECIKRNPTKIRGGVRYASARLVTDAELAERRAAVERKDLP